MTWRAANAALALGFADMIAFGVPFLANPDLPARYAKSAPLNEPDPATFYGGAEQGYTDYPFLLGLRRQYHETLLQPGSLLPFPHIVAIETGAPVELVRVDLGTGQTESGQDYRKINPDGYVPALVLADGDVLTEGPAIVQSVAVGLRKRGSRRRPAAGSVTTSCNG